VKSAGEYDVFGRTHGFDGAEACPGACPASAATADGEAAATEPAMNKTAPAAVTRLLAISGSRPSRIIKPQICSIQYEIAH
jgi:hypothetical protein